MTFQYFIGLIIVTFALDFFIVALLDGVVGVFLHSIGVKHIKVVVRNTGYNY
jgi:hypothetical protein